MIENEVQTDVRRKLMDHAAPIDDIIAVLSMAKIVRPPDVDFRRVDAGAEHRSKAGRRSDLGQADSERAFG
jgi:hypothetical protein